MTHLNRKAAAVQAAIWFFSDRYVLNTSNPLHDVVVDIVNQIVTEGPLVQPPRPSLTLTPSHASGPVRSVAGTVLAQYEQQDRRRRHRRRRRAALDATVTATGGNMFSDAAGTVPILNGTTVPSGRRSGCGPTGPPDPVSRPTATAVVPTGNVYLYDGNAGVNDAQKLILAETATLTTTVQATAEFLPPVRWR